jgi:hypothetical protein
MLIAFGRELLPSTSGFESYAAALSFKFVNVCFSKYATLLRTIRMLIY